MRKREESGNRDAASGTTGAPEGEPSFDERLARLEAIVAELEKGEIALEPAIARYQEGVLLLKSCRGLLEGFRKQVEVLSTDAEGTSAPYPDDPDVRSGKAGS